MTLLLPDDDCNDPEISIVVPALNEEITIGTFIDWCKEGLQKAGVEGEILIVDSSTDGTAEIALRKGARVLRTPKRGLGRAYIDATGYIRGRLLIFGDCDCTYDFRDLKPFVDEYRKGAEYIMGSRFRGSIEKGAMPPLHQYFGTPLTTWMLNFIYKSRFSDIHCGMRALRIDAFQQINLQSQGWEYASEMIIKALRLGLRTAEVPIHFFRDMKGRTSHHKRMGWLSPWLAGWQNMRAFFVYRPDFFLRKPGYLMTVIGAMLVFGLAFGPIRLGRLEFALYSQVFGLFMMSVGYGFLQVDALTTLYLGYEKRRNDRLRRVYRYDIITPLSWMIMVIGAFVCLISVINWVGAGFRIVNLSYGFVTGLGLLTVGFQTYMKSLTIYLFSLLRQR